MTAAASRRLYIELGHKPFLQNLRAVETMLVSQRSKPRRERRFCGHRRL